MKKCSDNFICAKFIYILLLLCFFCFLFWCNLCVCAVASLWVWLSSDFHLWQREKAKKNELLLFHFFCCVSCLYFSSDGWTLDIGHRPQFVIIPCSVLRVRWAICGAWHCGDAVIFAFFLFGSSAFFVCELNSHFVIKCVCVWVCMHSVPFVIVVGRRDFCRWFQCCCCCCYFGRRSSFIVCGHCQKRKMSIREMYKQWKMTQTNCTATHKELEFVWPLTLGSIPFDSVHYEMFLCLTDSIDVSNSSFIPKSHTPIFLSLSRSLSFWLTAAIKVWSSICRVYGLCFVLVLQFFENWIWCAVE